MLFLTSSILLIKHLILTLLTHNRQNVDLEFSYLQLALLINATQWFYFQTGMCGANIPLRVDLRGQGLPSDGQTLEIDVCGSYNIQGKWDCCVLRQEGYIHNCGGYYVYKLRAPDRCSVGYCMLGKGDATSYSNTRLSCVARPPRISSMYFLLKKLSKYN